MGREVGGSRNKLWWNVAWLPFFSSFFFCYYATEDRNVWLWVGMLSALGADLVIAMRALGRSDREFGPDPEPIWRGRAGVSEPARPGKAVTRRWSARGLRETEPTRG